jgi:hypothetical protein
MTQLETLRTESRALIECGRERFEDSVVAQAIARYLSDVGAVPAQAWGTLPISATLRTEWTSALDNRITEAQAVHTETAGMADGLMQIAADYEGTDLQVATNFDATTADLQPYLAATDGYSPEMAARRGGAGVVNTWSSHDRSDHYRPDVQIPAGNDRLTATRGEKLPSVRVVANPYIEIGTSDGNDFAFSGGNQTFYDNGDGDALDRFLQEYKDVLLQLEAFIQEIQTGHRLPLTDLIIHAWRSAPKVIMNRADLVFSASNTYDEMRTKLDGDTDRLALYWEGAAAAAYGIYAKTTSTYLNAVKTEAS